VLSVDRSGPANITDPHLPKLRAFRVLCCIQCELLRVSNPEISQRGLQLSVVPVASRPPPPPPAPVRMATSESYIRAHRRLRASDSERLWCQFVVHWRSAPTALKPQQEIGVRLLEGSEPSRPESSDPMREAGAPSTGECTHAEAAHPTGGSHGRTTKSPAQRFRGAKLRPRYKRMGVERGRRGIIEAEIP
jgi:hypothetical protein